jgi:hypothetical protein
MFACIHALLYKRSQQETFIAQAGFPQMNSFKGITFENKQEILDSNDGE